MYPPNPGRPTNTRPATAPSEDLAYDQCIKGAPGELRAPERGESLARQVAEKHRMYVGGARADLMNGAAVPPPSVTLPAAIDQVTDRLSYQRELLEKLTLALEKGGLLRPCVAACGGADGPSEKSHREPRTSERIMLIARVLDEHSSAIGELLDRLDV